MPQKNGYLFCSEILMLFTFLLIKMIKLIYEKRFQNKKYCLTKFNFYHI